MLVLMLVLYGSKRRTRECRVRHCEQRECDDLTAAEQLRSGSREFLRRGGTEDGCSCASLLRYSIQWRAGDGSLS